MINKVTLIGRAGKDPEVRHTESTTVANFSLATTEKYTSKSGEKRESTQWHNITTFGSQAEFVEKYIKKGKLLYIEGKIVYNEYEKNGEKRYSTSIVSSTIKFLDKKQDDLPF